MGNEVLAQEYQYVPFPDSNAVWSEAYWGESYSEGSQSDSLPINPYKKFVLFNEDTVINGFEYHKLFYTTDTEINKENSVCIGGIREDSLKKVWFYCFEYPDYYFRPALLYVQNEIKLFDFNIEVGDTVRNSTFLLEYLYLVVGEVDTIKINNTYRKVYSFANVGWDYWIEGVGNINGLLFPSGDRPGKMSNDLICMHQNDTLHYMSPDYNDCFPTFVHNGYALLPNTDIKVYPNPVVGEHVYFENLDFETLELFDVKGCLLNTIDIEGKVNYTLEVANYSKGIYFYQLQTKRLIPTRGKLIIE